MEADISSQAVGLASSADFSLMNLFIRADIIVKSVIIILIACSVYSWAVIFEKFKLFHVSTGDLLRNEIKKKSDIGKKIVNETDIFSFVHNGGNGPRQRRAISCVGRGDVGYSSYQYR